MDIHGYWISVGYGCLSMQPKNAYSIHIQSNLIQIRGYPIIRLSNRSLILNRQSEFILNTIFIASLSVLDLSLMPTA
jgi:hypothetical protein